MFKSRIPEIVAALPARVEAIELRTAERAAERARDKVPRATGALHDAIHIEKDEHGGYFVVAGNKTAFYGHIVEHGGMYTAPHPFMVPAAEETRAEIFELGLEELGKL